MIEGILEHQEGRKNMRLFPILLLKKKAEDENFEKGKQSESQEVYEKEERNDLVMPMTEKWLRDLIREYNM